MKKLSLKLKLRIAFSLVIGLAFLFFIYQAIVPFGCLKGEYRPRGLNFWGGQKIVGPLGPSDRISWDNEYLRLIKSPAYFSVFSPREFKQAKLTFVYRNLDPAGQPIIETGVLVDEKLWRFATRGLENLILEKLMNTWDKQIGIDNGKILLTNPDPLLKLKSSWPQTASYQTDYDPGYLQSALPFDTLGDYAWPQLRGDQQILAAINGLPLRFEFSFSDLNQNNQAGGDPIAILIYNSQNELISSQEMIDDGSETASGEIKDRGGWQLYRADLAPDIYRIEVRANDDIISSIKTTNTHVVLQNKAWLFSPANLLTDSSVLRVKTPNPDSLGKIVFADQNLVLEKTDVIYKATTTELGLKNINLTAGDIFLEVEGDIAFSADAFFLSGSKKLTADLNLGEISSVVAKYSEPEDLGDGWRRATAVFDLSGVNRVDNRYKFMLSLPDLTQGVEIKSIRAELSGQSLGGKIKKMFNL